MIRMATTRTVMNHTFTIFSVQLRFKRQVRLDRQLRIQAWAAIMKNHITASTNPTLAGTLRQMELKSGTTSWLTTLSSVLNLEQTGM